MQWMENLEKIGKSFLANAWWGFLFCCGGGFRLFFLSAIKKLGFLHFQVARSHITQDLKGAKQESDSVIILCQTGTPWHNWKHCSGEELAGGEKMQRRYLSNPVFCLNDWFYCSNRNYWTCPENNKTQPSIMLFNKVLHQKVFTMNFKMQKVSREKRKKTSIHSRTPQRQI